MNNHRAEIRAAALKHMSVCGAKYAIYGVGYMRSRGTFGIIEELAADPSELQLCFSRNSFNSTVDALHNIYEQKGIYLSYILSISAGDKKGQ